MSRDYDPDFDDDYEDYDSDEEVDTILCPSCKTEVYEEAVACPNCGEFIIQSQSLFAKKPLWFVMMILAIIGYLIFMLVLP